LSGQNPLNEAPSLILFSVLERLNCHYSFIKSFFLNTDLKKTSHPHEMDNAGAAAVSTASIGCICVKVRGRKNTMKVATIISMRVIRSNIVLGGVRNILRRSISAFIHYTSFPAFSSTNLISLPECIISLSSSMYG